MKILVPIKRIPDAGQKIKLNGQQIDYTSTIWQINQFDEYALEAALRLNENPTTSSKWGEITTFSIGNSDIKSLLQNTLALGADQAVWAPMPSSFSMDSNFIAQWIAELAKRDGYDLILMGKMAADSENNEVGPRLAGILGWPQATFASSIQVEEDGKSLRVGREVDQGIEFKRVYLPAVVTVDLRIILGNSVQNGKTPPEYRYPEAPRFASLKGIMAAKKKSIEELSLADWALPTTPFIKTIEARFPEGRKAGMQVSSVAELIEKLKNEAKVL